MRDLNDVVEEDAEYAYAADPKEFLLSRAESMGAWGAAIEFGVSSAFWTLMCARGACKSPIEERFLAALWVGSGSYAKRVIDEGGAIVAATVNNFPDTDVMRISAQKKFDAYKVDFEISLISDPTPWGSPAVASVVVELDGHGFHEKTKAQAAHDKKRDRFFVSRGIAVLRFTGSEIHKDAPACAKEAVDLLMKSMGALWRSKSP